MKLITSERQAQNKSQKFYWQKIIARLDLKKAERGVT